MNASDIMTSPVISVGSEAEIQEIAKLLLEKRISAVPVVDDEGSLVGIVSEGDLMRRPGLDADVDQKGSWWLSLFADPVTEASRYVKGHGRFAREVMTREVITVSDDTSLSEIALVLAKHRIKRVPLLRDGRMVGIVSRANLLHGVATAPRPRATTRDDGALRANLQAAVRKSGIRASYVNIVVTDGVAHLWGAMESDQERDALTVIIENVDGLKGVESHVGVMPPMIKASMGAQ